MRTPEATLGSLSYMEVVYILFIATVAFAVLPLISKSILCSPPLKALTELTRTCWYNNSKPIPLIPSHSHPTYLAQSDEKKSDDLDLHVRKN